MTENTAGVGRTSLAVDVLRVGRSDERRGRGRRTFERTRGQPVSDGSSGNVTPLGPQSWITEEARAVDEMEAAVARLEEMMDEVGEQTRLVTRLALELCAELVGEASSPLRVLPAAPQVQPPSSRHEQEVS